MGHIPICQNPVLILNGSKKCILKPRSRIVWIPLKKGSLVKRQVVIPAGRIDLLCSDSNNMPVVLELKAGNGDNSVIRQIKNYIDCIEKETGLKTKGIIVIQNPNPELESDASQNGIRTFVWKRTKTKKQANKSV